MSLPRNKTTSLLREILLMKRVFARFGAAVVLACAITALLGAQEAVLQLSTGGDDQAQGASDQALVDETPTYWFVELASPPTADGTNLTQVRQEKANFRSAAAAAHLNYSERYAFDTLWNGLSVRIAKAQVSALSHVPGVKAVY